MSYIGTSKVGNMYLGDTKIGKAYLGEDLVYSSAQQTPVVEYIGDWQSGYKLGNNGKSIYQDSAYMLTPYYVISPKDKIRYDVGTSTPYSVISELPDNFTDISQSVDWWSQSTRPKTITTGSSTHYVIFAIPKANLDIAYIYNETKGIYLYNGAVDNPYKYITDGLVFHLDGADATTTEWVDKIGNIAFTMNNVTLDGNGGVVFNGTSSYGNYSSNLDFPSSTHTIEVVLNGTQAGGLRVAFMINASNKLAFGYSSDGTYIVTKSGNSNARSTWRTTINTGIHVFSVTPSGAYDNGSAMTVRSTDTWYLRTGGTFVGSRSADNAFFKGTIYQIRVYNRALTSDEILHNHAIDISRYNITTT